MRSREPTTHTPQLTTLIKSPPNADDISLPFLLPRRQSHLSVSTMNSLAALDSMAQKQKEEVGYYFVMLFSNLS
jgi:hypothetical protein